MYVRALDPDSISCLRRFDFVYMIEKERDEELVKDNGQDLHRRMLYHDQMPDTSCNASKIIPLRREIQSLGNP
jgi:hypothetical protein